MKRALRTWTWTLVGAGCWLPAILIVLLNPEAPPVHAWAVALGVLGGCAATALGARAAAQGSAAPAVDGAWAGLHVAGGSWMLGALPIIGVWSQLPALVPLETAPSAVHVLATALAAAAVSAMPAVTLTAVCAVALGALIGWLAAGSGPRGLPAPHPLTVGGAGLALVYSVATLPAVWEALGPLGASVGETVDQGFLIAAQLELGSRLVLGPKTLVLLVVVAICALAVPAMALVVAGVRGALPAQRPWARLLVLGGLWATPSFILWAAGGEHRPELMAAWAACSGGGALVGSGVTLRPADRGASFWEMALTRALPTFMLSSIPSTVAGGLAIGLGAVARIPALSTLGTAAGPAREVTLQLVGGVVGSAVGALVLAIWALVTVGASIGWIFDFWRARRRVQWVADAAPGPERAEVLRGVLPWVRQGWRLAVMWALLGWLGAVIPLMGGLKGVVEGGEGWGKILVVLGGMAVYMLPAIPALRLWRADEAAGPWNERLHEARVDAVMDHLGAAFGASSRGAYWISRVALLLAGGALLLLAVVSFVM